MNWRQWIGLKPAEADLAADSPRDADHVISLVNIHREYARAGYLARPGLLRKYRAMPAPTERSTVPKLWTLAQTQIVPILRSRYDRTVIEIKYRGKDLPRQKR